MPKFNFEIPHNLTAEEAQSRVQRFAESMESKFGDKASDMHQTWNGNTLAFGFQTFGIKIAGEIESQENKLLVRGDLPLKAVVFKGKIESEMKQLLGRFMS